METNKVMYGGGEARDIHRYPAGVDYMLVVVDGVELYAETENHTWNKDEECFDDETATYEELKAAILEQAARHGIKADKLIFMYDEEEEK